MWGFHQDAVPLSRYGGGLAVRSWVHEYSIVIKEFLVENWIRLDDSISIIQCNQLLGPHVRTVIARDGT